jgi:hypothetical protein
MVNQVFDKPSDLLGTCKGRQLLQEVSYLSIHMISYVLINKLLAHLQIGHLGH